MVIWEDGEQQIVDEEEENVEVIPQPPDESKWDIIYALPFFGKPGKHHYMIKMKNTKEQKQKSLIKKQQKLKQMA